MPARGLSLPASISVVLCGASNWVGSTKKYAAARSPMFRSHMDRVMVRGRGRHPPRNSPVGEQLSQIASKLQECSHMPTGTADTDGMHRQAPELPCTTPQRASPQRRPISLQCMHRMLCQVPWARTVWGYNTTSGRRNAPSPPPDQPKIESTDVAGHSTAPRRN